MRPDVIELKDADPSTLAELVALEEETFGRAGLNEWVLPVFMRYGRVFILSMDGEIVGAAELIKDWSNFDLTFLVSLAIKKGHRSKGWGQFFLSEIAARLHREGLDALYLTVSPQNDAALSLYRKLGFVKVAFLPAVYGKNEDRLLMCLRLGDIKKSG